MNRFFEMALVCFVGLALQKWVIGLTTIQFFIPAGTRGEAVFVYHVLEISEMAVAAVIAAHMADPAFWRGKLPEVLGYLMVRVGDR